MDKVIKLLNSEKKHLPNQIRHCIDEIEKGKAAIKDLQSSEFVERNKDRECWSEDWTIQDYIELNVDSTKRSIDAYSERLAEKKDYLSQIERALKILEQAKTMSNGKYVLVQKTVSKITDETKCEELIVSDDIMDILNRLMDELKIDYEHYCSIEMIGAKNFVSETFDRTYIYSIHFKKESEVMRFKED